MVTLCVSTSLVLILLGTVLLTTLTARNLSQYVKENLSVTVMFDDNVSNREARVVCRKLQTRHYVNHLEYISREQALKEQTQALGTDPSEFLGMNPFVPSAELRLKADCANADSMAWITKDLKRYPQVAEVSYQKDLMDSVNRNLGKVSVVMLALAVVLAFISLSLINNMVRLNVYARRLSINTMKLVGASWSFIRWPFIKTAIFEGLAAAFIADAALCGIGYALYNFEPGIAEVVTWIDMASTAGAVILFGLFISTVCVYFSVNRYLRMPAHKLYKV